MTKKLITHENYDEPFEDRRSMPRIDEDIRTWWPIYTSVAGMLIVIGVWLTVIKSTSALATDTACEVRGLKSEMIVLKTELPIMKCDIKEAKDDMKKVLSELSSIKARLWSRNDEIKNIN